jgi:hypothetical protein
MKKFFVAVLLVMISAYSLGLFLPWWSVAIAGFIAGLFLDQKAIYSFLSAFIAVFLLWGIMSYVISIENENILAKKISMLILKRNSPELLVLLGAFIGGIVCAFSALTGSFLKIVLHKD